MLGPQVPGRELPGEVATRRFWSVCKPLGAALLGTTEGAGPAETPPSEALGLHTKTGPHYPEVRGAGPGNTGVQGGAQQGFSNGHTRIFGLLSRAPEPSL